MTISSIISEISKKEIIRSIREYSL
jgi:hypothetical protein